ncbi:hypothetical protein AB0H43_22335 [Hamadaea sp. NPDC050747]|uniref:hypothetical protein n=1 Tax=Hamadaea sp. NPDC050747 TaxID=3155789 RepID=UPI0033D269B6
MSSQPIPPIVPAAAVDADLTDEERADDRRPDADDETIADDGTPVGRSDRDADVRRTGADPDAA